MNEPFPKPSYHGTRRLWRLSELLAYERASAGQPPDPPLPPADEHFLTAAQVKARYGGVSDMWLWRRLHGCDNRTRPAVRKMGALTGHASQ